MSNEGEFSPEPVGGERAIEHPAFRLIYHPRWDNYTLLTVDPKAFFVLEWKFGATTAQKEVRSELMSGCRPEILKFLAANPNEFLPLDSILTHVNEVAREKGRTPYKKVSIKNNLTKLINSFKRLNLTSEQYPDGYLQRSKDREAYCLYKPESIKKGVR